MFIFNVTLKNTRSKVSHFQLLKKPGPPVLIKIKRPGKELKKKKKKNAYDVIVVEKDIMFHCLLFSVDDGYSRKIIRSLSNNYHTSSRGINFNFTQREWNLIAFSNSYGHISSEQTGATEEGCAFSSRNIVTAITTLRIVYTAIT